MATTVAVHAATVAGKRNRNPKTMRLVRMVFFCCPALRRGVGPKHGRLKQDEHLAFALADLRKRVGNLARRESRVAWFHDQGVVAHLDEKFAVDHIETLALAVVAVQGRPARRLLVGRSPVPA